MAYTQDNRHISITTPLGKDVLLLQGISGQEAVSRLFTFNLDFLSEKPNVDPNDIVGKNVTVEIRHAGGTRYINGFVSRFSQGDGFVRSQGATSEKFASYRAEVVPWLWFLTKTADCRIFQKMTVPDIIQKIFKDLGFTDFKLALAGSFQPREYCVQYKETDFNFVARLMEECGIFYYFEHTDGKHTLVLGNSPANHPACTPATARYQQTTGDIVTPDDIVTSWTKAQEFRPGKWVMTDYNFETPSTSLLVNAPGVLPGAAAKFEIYDYPGEYLKRADGEALVRIRMEEEESDGVVINGAGTCPYFTAGFKVTLTEHPRTDFNNEYMLRGVEHAAREGSYTSNDEADYRYANTFIAMPGAVPFRPPRTTPRPTVQGSQSAVVVGPAGEEIWTDKYGRVKVQFHWDREGKKDENSSCWIRVSHPWAGKGWGLVSIPRIGQEVIVDFFEGDPDQPIIVGRVYNGELMPPYPLPAGGVVSGLKSNSTKGGGGYNEMSMDDTKGKEMITLHGQYDMQSTIEHDMTGKIVNDETLDVGNDRTRSVGGNESVTVAQSRTHTVGINEAITVGAAQEITIGGLQAITVGAIRTISVGANQSVDVNMNESVQIGKDQNIQIGANLNEKVGKNLTQKVGGDRTATIDKNENLKVAKVITIDAGDQIVIKTGSAKITMKSNGDIQITGKKIEMNGTQAIEQEAANITAKASAANTIKGSVVKIN